MIIVSKFHQNLTSGFRAEVKYVNCLRTTDDGRRTKVDHNRSPEVFRCPKNMYNVCEWLKNKDTQHNNHWEYKKLMILFIWTDQMCVAHRGGSVVEVGLGRSLVSGALSVSVCRYRDGQMYSMSGRSCHWRDCIRVYILYAYIFYTRIYTRI